MRNALIKIAPDYDVVVLGGGAGGMSAAVFAALEGARVLLVERTEYLGGTSAFSAATTWIPLTRHAKTVGADDSLEKVSGFLDRAVGNLSPKRMRDAFLAAGPGVVDTLEDRTDVHLRPRPFHPDYLYELEGATSIGRALEPEPFEASSLGEDLKLIRPPIPEFTILGGMMIDRDDIAHLMKIGKSLKSTTYSLRLIGRFYLSKMRYGRDSRLLMGNALIGRMLKTARKLGVTILTETETVAFASDTNGVTGITLRQKGFERQVAVRGGVVLASGGFARHPGMREEKLPHPVPQFSPSAPGHTGTLHELAFGIGAYHGETSKQPCFWAPVSCRRRQDGSMAVFPHFVFDRSKPGIISVGKDGRRFVNESTSYHLFVSAMYAANEGDSHIPTYLIADAEALKKYGMGMIRPGGADIKSYLADGYLTEGKTLDELAAKLDINAAGLKDSVARINAYAKTGVDKDFARGTTVYEKANGDPTHGPNPTLGALETAPYYAVRLLPGDIGSAVGLVADENARLLRRDSSVIGGLYACGNDLQSIMGGVYPGPGITIGPAIVFGAIAARHAARRASSAAREQAA
ncbi:MULTISPECIES: FAD-dependent oxidoreductase [Alphaproteobacteria]|uniref:FAD-binding dehydrogenase n=2 Tax=Alphaproteobacteria TaxID=28211 RepID=A0A512HH95_9HYPH|nr:MULTISPECIES: FAD-dependent oxidoreductase [Alphaproteobacteria]GEO84817.1 FAD-binding dehydrogenase [Ciceribacter naphthalenivorans]GLR20562.1 FAD-binding dehydrogenase [Ciceribacter naphthalenivorans]GLT03418.1 FAD-binding dehydrogenase [Sphingomonas psychrolutea]